MDAPRPPASPAPALTVPCVRSFRPRAVINAAAWGDVQLLAYDHRRREFHVRIVTLASQPTPPARADALQAAIDRSGLDVAPCAVCGRAVVCLPDGAPLCEPCAQSAEA